MKRSAINEILGHTRQFFSARCAPPPFASFPPTQWRKLDASARSEVFDLKLGWDVTAFGGNNFAAQGLTLFTLRNGSPKGMPYEKCYAEKIMHVREAQVTPMHFHWRKREDIINRGGGNLIVELWNAGLREQTEDSDVNVVIDGCRQTHAAGSQLRLTPGRASACRRACITASGRKKVLATCWLARSHLLMTTTTITIFCNLSPVITTLKKMNRRSWCCVTNIACSANQGAHYAVDISRRWPRPCP